MVFNKLLKMEDKSTIFLIQGDSTDDLNKKMEDSKIIIFDYRKTFENASDKIFNESKFFGMICLSVAQGNLVAIINSQDYITKKGNLSIFHALISRIPGTTSNNYNFIIIAEKDYSKDKQKLEEKNPTNMLYIWGDKYAKIISPDEFLGLTITPNIPFKSDIKVTCGLIGKFIDNDSNIICGHITRAFNISLEEALKLEEDNKFHVGKKYNGNNISLMVENKKGGNVMMIKDLGETAHITLNTTIKSSLSGQILEKYNNKILEFNIQDIDHSIKLPKNIIINHSHDALIEITGWYIYNIEVKEPK